MRGVCCHHIFILFIWSRNVPLYIRKTFEDPGLILCTNVAYARLFGLQDSLMATGSRLTFSERVVSAQTAVRPSFRSSCYIPCYGRRVEVCVAGRGFLSWDAAFLYQQGETAGWTREPPDVSRYCHLCKGTLLQLEFQNHFCVTREDTCMQLVLFHEKLIVAKLVKKLSCLWNPRGYYCDKECSSASGCGQFAGSCTDGSEGRRSI